MNIELLKAISKESFDEYYLRNISKEQVAKFVKKHFETADFSVLEVEVKKSDVAYFEALVEFKHKSFGWSDSEYRYFNALGLTGISNETNDRTWRRFVYNSLSEKDKEKYLLICHILDLNINNLNKQPNVSQEKYSQVCRLLVLNTEESLTTNL